MGRVLMAAKVAGGRARPSSFAGVEAWTLHRAAGLVGGEVRGPGGDVPVTRWTYDSRLPAAPEGNCFLALGSGRRSGVDYVPELMERGVGLFCVSVQDVGRLSPKHLARGTFWIVPDVLASVQALAAEHRKSLRGEVIAITGSNGKTIVKEWLYALLMAAGVPTYRSPASHNSQLGVALSVLHDRDPNSRVHVFEAGVSRAGEMAALREMIRPTLGLLTNIGAAHDDGFRDRAQKVREKLSLFTGAKALVYDWDDLLGSPEEQLLRSPDLLAGATLLAWSGEEYDGEPASELTTLLFGGNELTVIPPQGEAPRLSLTFPSPFADPASQQNLGHALVTALAVGRRLGITTSNGAFAYVAALRQAIPTLAGLDMRLQACAGRGGHRVIDDSYTADREGLRTAAEFFAQHRLPYADAVWVLGPLADGGSAAETLAFVGELVGRHRVQQLLTVGDDYAGAAFAPEIDHRHFDGVPDVIASLRSLSDAPATYLVKGPRAMRFDRIAQALRQRGHGLRLEISLPALAHNVAAFRSRLGAGERSRPAAKLCVMVKAEAYGAGGPEVAAFFEQRDVDYLAVATVDEGVAIREAGVRLAIIVANAAAGEEWRLRANALEPEVTDLETLRRYGGAGAPDGTRPLRLHVKLDTGMHRLGFDATRDGGAGLDALVAELRTGRYEVASVFSHLSAADRADAADFTAQQHERLLAGAARIERALGYRPMRHLLNSAGAWRYPELQHDMVRLGIGVYGVGLEGTAPGALEPAHRWVAQIVQVRVVPAGEPVGYDLRGAADHDRRIGVVNVGYADGLRRAAGNGRYALVVDGRLAPIVGNVCMDFTMVDLAHAPRATVGDDVVVFGPEQPVQVLAKAYDTIPYEVFTGIGSRVRRVFYR